MKRALAIAAAVLLLGCCAAAPSTAAAALTWRSVQPPAPAPPPGVAPAAVPVGLGEVGDIEFFAPNRGLLITGGNDVVSPGLWYWDGQGWSVLSTVCGGAEGRIAWAGPNEFWTVSDGRPGQVLANGTSPAPGELSDLSLCHFKNGELVGSYATPLETATSYLAMHAALCVSAEDCWFGGERLSARVAGAVGAFHLHWNGQSLVEVDGPQGHAVRSMALYQGKLIEAVQPEEGDLASAEAPSAPALLHRILPFGTTTQPFVPFPVAEGLPAYDFSGSGTKPGVVPTAFEGPRLAVDGPVLWAALGAKTNPPVGGGTQQLTILRDTAGTWTQVLGFGAEPPGGPPFSGYGLGAIAAEPGTGSALLALQQPSDNKAEPALVDEIEASGALLAPETVPTPGDELGPKGRARRVSCPAAGDCWLVTTSGWLFQRSDGIPEPLDQGWDFTTPITFRPTDSSTTTEIPVENPLDDSGAEKEEKPKQVVTEPFPEGRAGKRKPLVSDAKSHIVHRTTLVFTFLLHSRAHVQLIASRKKKVVAESHRYTLAAGHHSLRLKLDPKRWPTALRLKATPAKTKKKSHT